jgi:hypothetical protein
MIETKYFLSRSIAPLYERHPAWAAPLPLHRDPGRDPAPEPALPFFSYGDYFTGVRAFLEKDAHRPLIEAIHQQSASPVREQDIEAVHIHLEKHGEFYHPARIAVRYNGREAGFVVNAAISPAGKATIHREYAVLKRLRKDFPWTYLPAAYALDTVYVHDDRMEMTLYLGEWFEGYQEFHISENAVDGETRICVWDEQNGHWELDADTVSLLYRQAAKILTCYYNLYSFEQIGAWHHAAGDFIIAPCPGGMDMKLITVRQYTSMIDATPGDLEAMVHAIWVFLLNLSLRMRVDRCGGIGDLVWADNRAVDGTAQGFADGMSRKAGIDPLAEALAVLFKNYFASCTPGDLLDVAAALVDTYPPQAPETVLIRRHLGDHCSTLYHALRRCIC